MGECMMELKGAALATDLPQLQQSYGGDSFNTSYYLARLSPPAWTVSFATSVGEDGISDRLLARWAKDRIALSLVRRIPKRTIGVYLIETDDQGERSFSFWRSESAARRYFDVEQTPLEHMLAQSPGEVNILYFTGISLAILDASGRERLLSTAARVQAQGGRVVFDNNFRPALWASPDEARLWMVRAISAADLALVTLDDHLALLGSPPLSEPSGAIDDVLACGAKTTVIKRGSLSTLAFLGKALCAEVPTITVPRVVDTTAAGDSFAAGYLLAEGHGLDMAIRLAWGNRLAAAVIQQPGAIVPVDRDLLSR
jgi:2-dehydro-3-deoxygluconokinase